MIFSTQFSLVLFLLTFVGSQNVSGTFVHHKEAERWTHRPPVTTVPTTTTTKDTIQPQLDGIHERLTSIHQQLTSIHEQLTSIHQQLVSIHAQLVSIHTQLQSIHQQLANLQHKHKQMEIDQRGTRILLQIGLRLGLLRMF